MTAAIRHLLGYVELVAGRLNRAREQAAAAVQDAKDAGDQLTYAHATSLLFLVDFLAGSQPSEDALADALALEQATDAAPRPTPPSVVRALRLMYLDRLDEARAHSRTRRRAANRGDEEMVEAVRFHSARGSSCARETGRALPSSPIRSPSWPGRPRTPVRPPRVDPSADRCLRRRRERIGIRGRRRNGGRGSRDPGTRDASVARLFELSRGNTAESVRLLEPLPTRLWELGYGEPSHLQAIPNLVDAYIGLGRPDDARPRSSRSNRMRSTTRSASFRPRGARALAAASGDVDTAVAHFEQRTPRGVRTLLRRTNPRGGMRI